MGGTKVNINTATVEELMTLPRIGEVMAQRIFTYREANGSFQALEDLLNVEGIGEQTLENLAPLITLN
jgi:competence protein ComEA